MRFKKKYCIHANTNRKLTCYIINNQLINLNYKPVTGIERELPNPNNPLGFNVFVYT